MISHTHAAETSDFAASPAALPAGMRARILAYLGVLLVLLGFGSPGGGLIWLPVSFLLKNKLHLEAHEMAIFGLIVGRRATCPSSSGLRATLGIRSACGIAVSWCCSAACARPCMWRLRSCL